MPCDRKKQVWLITGSGRQRNWAPILQGPRPEGGRPNAGRRHGNADPARVGPKGTFGAFETHLLGGQAGTSRPPRGPPTMPRPPVRGRRRALRPHRTLLGENKRRELLRGGLLRGAPPPGGKMERAAGGQSLTYAQ